MAKPLINITSRQAYTFACFLVLYEFLTYIANDMIMPGMIQVVNTFHGSESAIPTSLTAYILGGASLQLFLGPLSDRYGRRPVMLWGAVIFFMFTIMIASSMSMTGFLAARFFQGMGLCFIGVIGYATLQEIFAEMDAIRLTAIMANIAILAPLIGPLLGALVIAHFSWRIIFVVIAVFALLALWGLWRYMPEPIGQIKSNGEEIKRVSLEIGVVAANYKALLRNPAFMYGSLTAGILLLPCLVWIALAPIILITEGHLSVISYGIWQIPLFGACIVGNWILQRLTYKHNLRQIISIGSSVSCLGLLTIYLFPIFMGEHYIWLLPGFILNFLGMGMTGAPLTRFILFSTHVSKGTASALMSMITMVMQGVGIEFGSYFYQAHNNVHLGLFCVLLLPLYILMLVLTFYFGNSTEPANAASES